MRNPWMDTVSADQQYLQVRQGNMRGAETRVHENVQKKLEIFYVEYIAPDA